MNPKISVIIPCYGASETIASLAMDLTCQTYSDFEAIFVNDGDKRQIDILKKISNMDCRFKVANKENGGVSSARNAGLNIAKGDFIAFVDADDRLSEDFLFALIQYAEDVDLVIAGYITNNISNNKMSTVDIENCSKADLKHTLTFLESYNCFRAPWSKLFRAKIINSYHLRFNENFSFAEDWIFILEYLRYINKIRFQKNSGYTYNVGYSSNLMSKYDAKHILVREYCLKIITKIWEDNGFTKEYICKKTNEYQVSLCFSMLKNLYCTKNNPSFIESIDIIKKQLLQNEPLLVSLNNFRISKNTEKIQKIIIQTRNAYFIAILHYILYSIRQFFRKNL